MPPLHAEHFSTLQELTCLAWASCGVSAEQVRFLRTEGQPYLTAFRVDRVACSGYCILSNLYYARGLARTAQHFLATPVGADTRTNVINVHAPSGSHKLHDGQRNELLTNLLQSRSLNDAAYSVGHDRYIIGGDFNTGELTHARANDE